MITWQFGNRLLARERGGVVVRLRLEIREGVVRQVVCRLEGGIGKARAQPPSELCNAERTTGVRSVRGQQIHARKTMGSRAG